MTNARLVCTSCGAVWVTGSAHGTEARAEGCLRCGGALAPAEEMDAPHERLVCAVAGATGAVGRAVAVRLDGLGVRLVEVSQGDPGELARALAGVEALFLVSARDGRDLLQQHVRTIDAAIAAGVKRIVYVSVVGATADATYSHAREHFHAEEHVRGSGVPFTVLRASYQLDLLPSLCSADGVVQNPAGDGRVAGVSRGDLADVAVAVLTEGDHAGRTYDVTGSEAQTMTEIAHQLELASGRRIAYVRDTLDAARASRLADGDSDWEAEGWASFFGAIAAGEMDVVTDTVTTVTGHVPQTFAGYLREHPESYKHLAAA